MPVFRPTAQQAPEASSHHGGWRGYLSGDTDLLGNLAGDIGHAITGTGTAIGKGAYALATDPGSLHPIRGAEHLGRNLWAAEKQQWGPFAQGYGHLVEAGAQALAGNRAGAAKSLAKWRAEREQFNDRFHEHPLAPVLDIASLYSAGLARSFALTHLPEAATAGDVARAGLTGRYQGPLRTIEVATGEHGGTAVTRSVPRQGARAARMEATDALLKRTLGPSAPRVGEYARAARATQRAARDTKLRGLQNPLYRDWLHAFTKLDRWERAAFQIIVKLPMPLDLEQHILGLKALGTRPTKAQAALLSHPSFQLAYLGPHKRLQDAIEKGRALVESPEGREGLLAAAGEDMAALDLSPWRHMRAVRGEAAPAEDALRAEVAAAGRPQPYYIPDVLDHGSFLRRARGFKPSGLTPPASDVHAWQGVLFRSGLLALHPDVLGPSYLRAVARSYGLDLHERVKAIATPVAKGQGLPHGYEWVREVRGQRIPFTETRAGDFEHGQGHAFPEIGEELGPLTAIGEGADAAVDAQGRRLMVPSALANELRREVGGARSAGHRIFDEATGFWRALVLNLRVPWLENNVVGNHLLYALRFAGVDGLIGYLAALREVKGAKAVEELLNLPATKQGLTQEEMQQVFASQGRAGTFIGSQRPENLTGAWAKPARVAAKAVTAPLQLLPMIDRSTEGFLRRAGVNAALRPEARRIYRQMPKQTRDWKQAMLKAAHDPDINRLVVREVNDGLGDFLSLSPHERDYVRAAAPFYGWFKEITRILLKVPLDTPLRADALARLGMMQPDQDVPSFMQGSPAVGKLSPDGMQTFLALRTANPFTTPLDLAKAVSVLWNPKRAAGQQALSVWNPFLALLAQTIVKSANGDHNARSGLDAFYSDFLLGLPEVRAGRNPASKLYPTRTGWRELGQFAGDPRRDVDTYVASQYHAEGR